MKIWQKLKQNPRLWQRYFIRETIIKEIRHFFDAQGFHEVETPLLISHPPAESYLEIFETTLLDRQRHPKTIYLSTSPEVALKKLMVAGLSDCYALTKSFRNTEMQSNLHNPEFTILEWYRIKADYTEIMEDCEKILVAISQRLHHTTQLVYQTNTIDLAPPWERLTVTTAFKRYAKVDLAKAFGMEEMRDIVRGKGYRIESDNTWEELYNQIFLNEVEPKLGFGKPTILYEFPSSMAALAKKKEGDLRFAERFEFYIAGLELGDAYSELTDWKEQDQRFQQEISEIRRLGKTLFDYDHDFIDALKAGLPPCSGIAVGIDRLVMLFANVTDIADILFFPIQEENT